jgi:hypothetical protein
MDGQSFTAAAAAAAATFGEGVSRL